MERVGSFRSPYLTGRGAALTDKLELVVEKGTWAEVRIQFDTEAELNPAKLASWLVNKGVSQVHFEDQGTDLVKPLAFVVPRPSGKDVGGDVVLTTVRASRVLVDRLGREEGCSLSCRPQRATGIAVFETSTAPTLGRYGPL